MHTLGTQAPTMIRDRITHCLDSLDPLLNGLAVLGASNEGRHTYRFNRCLAFSLITAVLLTGLCLSSLNFGHWCSGELRSIDDMFVYAWGGPINAVLLCVIRLPLLWLLTAGLCAIALGMQSWMFRRVTELDDASFRCTRVYRLNAVIIAPPLWLIAVWPYLHLIWLDLIRGWESHPIRCLAALAAWGFLSALVSLWLTEVGAKFFKDQAESLVAQRARKAASASPLRPDDQAL